MTYNVYTTVAVNVEENIRYTSDTGNPHEKKRVGILYKYLI